MNRKVRNKTNEKMIGYILLIPSFIFLISFVLYPLCSSVLMSFTNWTGFNPDYDFVGLNNYIKLLGNKKYWSAIWINVQFAVVSTFIQTVLGFILAFFIYHLPKKRQNFYKVAIYIPVIIPASVIAVMWSFILSPENGLVNTILNNVGLSSLTHAWLGEVETALGSVILVNTWQYIGFTTVLFYIAMLNIDKALLESASIDGANKRQQFLKFFIPLTMSTTETNIILSITGGMKSFALFFLMTGGGPGSATRVASMVIYDTAFVDYKYYSALAMATVLFIIILILVIIGRLLASRYQR